MSGKVIFLFSGGVSHNFDQFRNHFQENQAEGATAGTASASSTTIEEKRCKLPDFLSRLRGHLNVKGINRQESEFDFVLKLRRAMILRSLLEEHATPIFIAQGNGNEKKANISDDVIIAFLSANHYTYQVRSMEAVIQSSRWIDSKFVTASLPSSTQIGNHVDFNSRL